MAGRYDVIVIGAGHNGLAAAAYLAKAGYSVLVVERNAHLGGTAVTDEFAPGFRASACFQSAETLHPQVVKDLQLPGHGLELLPAGDVFVPGGDNQWLLFTSGGEVHAGGEAMAAVDRLAYADFEKFLKRVVGTLVPVYTAPLPDLDDLGAGDKLDLLRIGWRLRRLGRADMQEAMRVLPMPVRDVVQERFASPLLCAAISGSSLTGSWFGPFSAGSMFNLVHQRIADGRRVVAGPVFARGGMGALGEALGAAARAAGAELRTGAEVRAIGDDLGRATGVVLADGEVVEAGTVLSGIDPRTTLLSLAEPQAFDPEFTRTAANIRARAAVAVVMFALGELPRLRDELAGLPDAASVLGGRIQIGPSIEYLEQAFDAGRHGGLPERPFVQLTIPSLRDPALAPEGKHVATAWVQTVPRHLDADDWEQGRERLADAVGSVIDGVLPGFTGLVESRSVTAPPDIEQRFGLAGGCLYHADVSLDQSLYLRPMAGWSQYRTPLRGLYLCGAGTHGGGGITGLAGRNAAHQVLGDLTAGRSG